MSIRKENELPEDFMIRMGMYFSGTVREDYFRVAGEITVLRTRLAALLARHNALVEAVAWERECCQDIRPLVAWADLHARHGEDYVDGVAEDLRAIQDAARAEVDRLLSDAADCEGEG